MSGVDWDNVFRQNAEDDDARIRKFNCKSIIGEILMLIIIPVGIWQIVEHGYMEQPIFKIFVGCALVYLLNRYVFHPFFVDCDRDLGYRGIPLPKYGSGESTMEVLSGTGELYLSSSTRMSCASGGANYAYRFFTILYLPLFPIAACLDPKKKRNENFTRYVYYLEMSWRWQEVVYIYLRNWSVFIMVFSTLMLRSY